MNLIRPAKVPAGPRMVASRLAPRVLPITVPLAKPSTPKSKPNASTVLSTAGSNEPPIIEATTPLSKEIVAQADQARGRQQLSRGEITPSTAYRNGWEHAPSRMGLLQKMQQIDTHRASSPIGVSSGQAVQLASSPAAGIVRNRSGATASAQPSPSFRPSIQATSSLADKSPSIFMDSVEIKTSSSSQRVNKSLKTAPSKVATKKPSSKRNDSTAPVSSRAHLSRRTTSGSAAEPAASNPSGSAPRSSRSNTRRASETDFSAAGNANKRAKKNHD